MSQAPQPYETNNQPNLVAENFRILEGAGEIGKTLVPVYATALAMAPELSVVRLTDEFTPPATEEGETTIEAQPTHKTASAIHGAFTKDGLHTIFVNLADNGIAFEAATKDAPICRSVMANTVGVYPADLKKELFASFLLGHELGHAVHFINSTPDKATFINERFRDMQTLPFSNRQPYDIEQWLKQPGGQSYFDNFRDYWAKKRDIDSVEKLIRAQAEAYRAMPTEARADQFALSVLAALPDDNGRGDRT